MEPKEHYVKFMQPTSLRYVSTPGQNKVKFFHDTGREFLAKHLFEC
jgi:hypothetical protein